MNKLPHYALLLFIIYAIFNNYSTEKSNDISSNKNKIINSKIVDDSTRTQEKGGYRNISDIDDQKKNNDKNAISQKIIDAVPALKNFHNELLFNQEIEDKKQKNIKNDQAINIVIGEENDKELGFVEQKISNIITDILRTDTGKEIVEKIIVSSPNNESDNLLNKGKQDPYHNNTIMDATKGLGDNIECGAHVTVHYIAKKSDGFIVESTRKTDSPISFDVGLSKKIIPGLQRYVLSMKKGGYRVVIVPPSLAYDAPNFSNEFTGNGAFISMEIEVLDVKQFVPNAKLPLRLFDIKNNVDINKEKIAICGSDVGIYLKVIDMNGNIIYNNFDSKSPLHFTLGNKNIPIILTKMLDKMGKNEQKSALVPIEYLKDISGNKTNFIPNLKNVSSGAYIFEVELISLGK